MADVALPNLLARLPDLTLAATPPVHPSGWAFRGLQHRLVTWTPP